MKTQPIHECQWRTIDLDEWNDEIIAFQVCNICKAERQRYMPPRGEEMILPKKRYEISRKQGRAIRKKIANWRSGIILPLEKPVPGYRFFKGLCIGIIVSLIILVLIAGAVLAGHHLLHLW